MKRLLSMTFACLCITSTLLQAEERYNHFPAIPSPDVATALCNLQKYNALLKGISGKTELSAEDMVKVHELTYTLENALARMTESLETAAVELEEAHLASERLEQEVIVTAGQKYLLAIQPFLASPACN